MSVFEGTLFGKERANSKPAQFDGFVHPHYDFVKRGKWCRAPQVSREALHAWGRAIMRGLKNVSKVISFVGLRSHPCRT